MGKDPKYVFYLGKRRSEMSESTRRHYEQMLAEFDKMFPKPKFATEVKAEWIGGKKDV